MVAKKKKRGAKPAMKQEGGNAQKKAAFAWSPAGIRQFAGEVQAEFAKIVWSGKKVTMGLTGFVVLLVVVLSLYLGTVDLLLGKLVGAVLN